MAGDGVERRLAAILCADVVGYSRLMEADEEATIRSLSACRQVIDKLVANHHGRVFGSAGDSVIAEFASPVEAVSCAADIQRELEERNADLPEDRRMQLRIGVNLGDVVVKGDNLLGDGVNIAARLEALADPGGICLSGTVFDQVDGKLDLKFDYLGRREVKNIAKLVRVYRSAAPSDMAEVGVTRKLTTILYADFLGYSRRTSEDDIGTHQMLSTGFDLVSDEIAEKGGRVVHYAGDSVLAEFGSVVAAVESAVSIQRRIEQVNADVQDDMRFQFCIGVDLGEVIVDRYGIYGDGVKVAERLEGLAKPGGICISGSVHEQVEGKLDLAFEDMGSQEVKNIAKPVRVYGVRNDKTGSTADARASKTLPLPDKPSIAVLPFENMSGDTEQEYFADGITEEIITTLSKISKLFVIARNSTLVYKGRAMDVKRVGREQGVRYVLEGSVRRGGNRMRITAQLIEAATGHHLWAQRYDREIGDIFALQDEITKEVVSALQIELTEGEQARLAARGTKNLEAWQLTFQARTLVHEHHQDGVHKARGFVEQALRLDENYALAWGVLAAAHWTEALNEGWSASREGSLELAIEASDRSLALDPSNAGALVMRGLILLSYRDFDEALALVEKALLSAHSQANTLATAAITLLACGKPEGAIKQINKAILHCPIYPAWYLFQLGSSYWTLGQSEEAIAAARSAIESDPDFSYAFVLLAMVYAETHRDAEARDAVAEVLRIDSDFSVSAWANGMPYRDPELEARQLAALRKSGLPE